MIRILLPIALMMLAESAWACPPGAPMNSTHGQAYSSYPSYSEERSEACDEESGEITFEITASKSGLLIYPGCTIQGPIAGTYAVTMNTTYTSSTVVGITEVHTYNEETQDWDVSIEGSRTFTAGEDMDEYGVQSDYYINEVYAIGEQGESMESGDEKVEFETSQTVVDPATQQLYVQTDECFKRHSWDPGGWHGNQFVEKTKNYINVYDVRVTLADEDTIAGVRDRFILLTTTDAVVASGSGPGVLAKVSTMNRSEVHPNASIRQIDARAISEEFRSLAGVPPPEHRYKVTDIVNHTLIVDGATDQTFNRTTRWKNDWNTPNLAPVSRIPESLDADFDDGEEIGTLSLSWDDQGNLDDDSDCEYIDAHRDAEDYAYFGSPVGNYPDDGCHIEQ